MFKTIEKEAEGIIIEKKSRFIANVFYIESEKEAEDILSNIRKKYHDAKHNCYVYRVKTKNGILQKQSDDGEPSGTAGLPMLNILEKRELINIIAIVTRYFGGILLGTGGLVKAYSNVLKEALKNANIVEKEKGYVVELVVGYENLKSLEKLCIKNNVRIIKKDYAEKIKILLEVEQEKYINLLQKELKDNFQNIPVIIKQEKNILIKQNPPK